MGQHADFVKGTLSTLQGVVDEGAKQYDEATDASLEREDREARADAREAADYAKRYPALGRR